MNNKDLQITFTVSQTPHEVFEAINNVSAWWNEEVIGNSRAMGDEFSVQFFVDVHYSKQLLEEVIPDRKVVWLVTDSSLSWLKDKEEWTGTRIVFEISEQDKKTQFKFTHIGLNPGVECYQDCYEGWHQYVGGSLLNLSLQEKGNRKKWRLTDKMRFNVRENRYLLRTNPHSLETNCHPPFFRLLLPGFCAGT